MGLSSARVRCCQRNTSKYWRKGGKVIFIDKIVIDDSGMSSFDPDYAVVHEFAHAILAVTKGDLGYNKKHADLTHKLAQKFGLT